jgi:hypothetical protein
MCDVNRLLLLHDQMWRSRKPVMLCEAQWPSRALGKMRMSDNPLRR